MTLSVAQKDDVRRLADEGKSGRQIAEIIGGISREGIVAVARRMGLKLHGPVRGTAWTVERDAQLRGLWGAGFSSTHIAEMMLVTQKSVLQRRCRLKLPTRSNAEMNRRFLRGAVARRVEAKVRQPTVPKERPLPPTSSPVSLMDRREDQCAWVIGETKGPSTMFCGAPTRAAACWCEYHTSIGYVAPYVRSLRVPEAV